MVLYKSDGTEPIKKKEEKKVHGLMTTRIEADSEQRLLGITID